jgi:SAM-dependent methyltransferase
MKIKIDHGIRSLIPRGRQKDLESLEASLLTNGCRYPLKLWGRILLDGHKRLAICRRHGLPFETEQVRLPDRAAAKLWVQEAQLVRHDLTDDQRAAIAVRVLRHRLQMARAAAVAANGMPRAPTHHCHGEPSTPHKAMSREVIAKEARVSEYRVQAAARLERLDRQAFRQVIAGKKGLNEARIEVIGQQRAAVRQAVAAAVKRLVPQVRNADFRVALADIPDGSIDLIFTDPPYDNESIPLYADLAKLAARVLAPGGSLVCYAGVPALPKLFPLMTPHITFWWQFCLRLQGAFPRFHSRRVHVHYKPLLWFVKGQFKRDYVIDVIESTWLAKNWHDWEQSEAEAAHCITKLTPEDGIVLDPMCGSGTTLLAARRLHRRFIGAEIDPLQAKVATARLRHVDVRHG